MTKKKKQSIFQKLQSELAILISETPPGERLLTEPKLAKQLGVSRATLREAIRTFETQGLIRRRQGSGTYVLRPPQVIETGVDVLESIETMAARIGLPVASRELKIETRTAKSEEAKALGISSRSKVIEISRVIITGDKPVAYLIDILPAGYLSADEVPSDFTGSVLDLLLERGHPALSTSRTEITADAAETEIAKSMHIQRRDPLLCLKAFLYATSGEVVDYSFSYFLPGHFRFNVERRVGGASA